MKFTLETEGIRCVTQTTATNPLGVMFNVDSETGDVTELLRADETQTIPLRGSFSCPIAGELSVAGTATVTLLGNTTRIRLRLI